jgi:microcystin-dependent protein
MSEPFLGQICSFGFNFAPRGWSQCNGQLMSISQNTALFSLLGTTYGGDGVTTFALPNLQGRVPLHQGQGPGLTNRVIGEQSGSETVTLNSTQMPQHNHIVSANSTDSNPNAAKSPAGNFPGYNDAGPLWATTSNSVTMNPQMVNLAGGNQPHENMQPYLVINFCIALEGIFPSRN